MTAALRRWFRERPIRTSAVLLGSVAPDIPLYLLSLGAFLLFRYGRGWSAERTFETMYGELYFQDPWWIVLHNLLHAPLLLIPVMLLTAAHRWSGRGRGHWLFWFAASCLFHTLLDFGTHYDDGSLTFFPVNWHFRIRSPVSYWDPRHYGREFFAFEVAIDLVLLVLLWYWHRKDRVSVAGSR